MCPGLEVLLGVYRCYRAQRQVADMEDASRRWDCVCVGCWG